MARSKKTRTAPAPAPRARTRAKRAPRGSRSQPPSRGWAVGLLCLVLAGFALLFWARLKLVTGVPRTAYADPSQSGPAGPSAPRR
jgi:hypothetical protein